jgi:hypothetical protein
MNRQGAKEKRMGRRDAESAEKQQRQSNVAVSRPAVWKKTPSPLVGEGWGEGGLLLRVGC